MNNMIILGVGQGLTPFGPAPALWGANYLELVWGMYRHAYKGYNPFATENPKTFWAQATMN